MFYIIRFSEKRLDESLKTSWKKKMEIRAEKKAIKTYEKELKAERSRRLEVIRNIAVSVNSLAPKAPSWWLSGERVGLMTWWL